MLRADLNGQVLLVEPDISPGLVDVISIVDDGGGPQSDSIIVYDGFAPKGLPTSTLHAVQMPDKRKVADKIAAAHGIRRRHEWGAERPKKMPLDQDWDYETVVIHHAGDVGRNDPKEIQYFQMYIADIQSDDIAYEYVVTRDGKIVEGRFLAYKSGANSQQNTGKIAILVAGDFEEQFWDFDDKPTEKQIQAVTALVDTLKRHFPLKRLIGHKDIPNLNPNKKQTDCPGNALYDKLNTIRSSTGLAGP
jgi:hypothetical protein